MADTAHVQDSQANLADIDKIRGILDVEGHKVSGTPHHLRDRLEAVLQRIEERAKQVVEQVTGPAQEAPTVVSSKPTPTSAPASETAAST